MRRLLSNAGGLAANRLALFSLELQEESERQLGHLVWLLVCALALYFFILFASVALLIWAWPHGYALAVACALALGHGILALALALYVAWRLRCSPRPFSATRAEFARDQQIFGEQPEDPP
ncbi:phage holin family protein [Candidatus Dactylopiibacterium carminicum]|uniref:phage holin family protein n=1 Tax=Candidatus Dactylopiibacterium carminicum TaxID=857335 RepID=UPI001481DED2|nr:phage holin family protein [Candidatus Dactylopiibacterium carminicum]